MGISPINASLVAKMVVTIIFNNKWKGMVLQNQKNNKHTKNNTRTILTVTIRMSQKCISFIFIDYIILGKDIKS